jgi:hypothetical protein
MSWFSCCSKQRLENVHVPAAVPTVQRKELKLILTPDYVESYEPVRQKRTESTVNTYTHPNTEIVTEEIAIEIDNIVPDITPASAVSGNATDVVSDNATDVVSDNATDVVSDNATDVVSGNATDVVSGNATDVVSGDATDVVSGNATDVVSGDATDAVSGNAPEVTSVDAPQVTSVDASQVTSANAPEVTSVDAPEVPQTNVDSNNATIPDDLSDFLTPDMINQMFNSPTKKTKTVTTMAEVMQRPTITLRDLVNINFNDLQGPPKGLQELQQLMSNSVVETPDAVIMFPNGPKSIKSSKLVYVDQKHHTQTPLWQVPRIIMFDTLIDLTSIRWDNIDEDLNLTLHLLSFTFNFLDVFHLMSKHKGHNYGELQKLMQMIERQNQ